MLTLALAVSLAAPVPKAAPFPLRTDPLPDEYKAADLADAALPRPVKGSVHLLAWERIEDDRPHTGTKVLVLKKFDKPDQSGAKWSLGLMYRHPKDTAWQYPFHDLPPPLPGETLPQVSSAYLFAHTCYADPPTDKALAGFLKDAGWTPKLGAEAVGGGKVLTTKLAGGGVDRAAWKTHFDRDPPADLFPELKADDK